MKFMHHFFLQILIHMSYMEIITNISITRNKLHGVLWFSSLKRLLGNNRLALTSMEGKT